ncbi:ATP-binding protein [Arsenicibacter rosenii]|uniref:histidine kinase n=1 Tax=Arsenicibacter rosenii TaxID=1750698 RepID=A0A1S2VGH7_9BACT|nr:ATP-binding protein [Arsenicibacter rosenii]OIN57832.1 hybrid sensor histidine kinase/response regulator [Arsenicibacter rosenii]
METQGLHKLLTRQINKYLSSDCLTNEGVQQFIKSVNESYKNFDRDKELFEHSSYLNEREYAEINKKLKEEINQRKQSVEKLVEAIHSIEKPEDTQSPNFNSENLVGLVEYLQQQIEHRKKIEIELRAAKEEAEKATQAKSDFLSMMSHEIRTPLNGIVGMTYLMAQEEVPPNIAENLKTLQFSIEHLHALINDILDFSKIEAGKVELEATSFDLKQLVSNIKQAHQLKAAENGDRIRLMVDDDIPESVIGDSLRISQVLSNLVSNAIKFTHDGTITIELSLQKQTATHAEVYISVKDTGIGIAPEKHQSIFEMFTQANSATTRKFGGTGLGLVITRRLLEMHGSSIHLESEEGKGAKFYFTINFSIGAKQEQPTLVRRDLLDDHSLKGVKVLLVEDYPFNVEVAVKFLTKWGVDVDVAENGQIGLDKFLANPYDIILMDLQMPVMDGYTATERIRAINKTIPIIALTASATFSNHDRAILSGISDYVTKPFNPRDLFQKLLRHRQAA